MANADRLIELFNGAQHLPAGAVRDAYLAKECGDDAELKAQVCSLVDAHESAGGFLQAGPELSPEIEAKLARFTPEEAGQQIGPYKLREQIGEGGFGTVWVAEQERPVRRTVALKIIKLGMDTQDVVARFGQERQALAMMDHPNIAKVFDAGVTGNGRPFFVMELVDGIKITDFCDQANLPTAERLALFIQVCHAVQHAHQKGIIHRDLKPSNILVTLHDGVPVPKVIDFGVAKATQGRLADNTVYTRLQQMIGTPLYMSPEQAEMNGTDVDTRTDIYTLGVLLYELLTGRTPFDADALLKAGYDEMRRVIREQEPQKPSTALVTMAQEVVTTVAHHRASEPPKLIHAIRGDLDWIVMKSLEKDRARRYDTANGLAADVQRHLDNEPVTARPPSTGYRLQKLMQRNQLAFAAGTAIAAAMVIGFTTATWMYFRESEARKRATQAEKLATQRLAEVSAERDAKEVARQEAEAISTFITEVFRSPDPARDGRTITVAETLDKASEKLETELAGQPARRVKLQTTLALTYDALALNQKAIPLLEMALDYHRTASGPEHPDTLEAMYNLASSYFADGRRSKALKMFEEELSLRRKVNGPEHPDTSASMLGLANYYQGNGRLDDALKLREEVLALHRKVSGPEHPYTLLAMNNLAVSYFDVGRRDESLKLREEVLALRRKVLGPEDVDTLWAMHFLAVSYHVAGRQDEALKLREDVLALFRKVLGRDHPHTSSAMKELSNSYLAVGRRDEAIKLREDVLTLFRKASGPEHRDTAAAMKELENWYRDAGRWDEAVKLREELLTIRRKALGPEHLDTLKAMLLLATIYDNVERRDEALKLREEALPLFRKVRGPEHGDTLWAMDELAKSYALGHPDEALKLREELLALRRKVSGPEHGDTLSAMSGLATSYHAARRRDEALKLREELLSLRRKVLGPEHRDTLLTMSDLAISYHAAGRRDEAFKLREEILTFRRKVLGREHSDTLLALRDLVDSYLQAGRGTDAISLLLDESTRTPSDTRLSLMLAALQVWFVQETGHAATRQRLLQWAADVKTHDDAERVAKLACLRPIDDAPTQAAALILARRALELGQGNTASLPWAYMTLGMAEYRSGNYLAADAALATAAETASQTRRSRPNVEGVASFYRAMSLCKQDRQTEARTLLTATEAKMKPWPADEKNPLAGSQHSGADELILWLACKEARALLNAPAGK